MTSATTLDSHATTTPRTDEGTATQLSLIPDDELPARFRLDAATVRRGRRHIAEIRQMLRTQDPPDVEAPSPLPHREPGAQPRRHAA